MPDTTPPHAYYFYMESATDFCGELDGRKIDFAVLADRIAAYKWYIDRVRVHFDMKRYKYVELAGFYIVSEDLVVPGDGWYPELKCWENVIPSVADYLHTLNELLVWIPYNRAEENTR